MEPTIRQRMTPDVLREAAAGYGMSPQKLSELDGFESLIYEATIGGQRGILRIGHSGRRPAPLVFGELDWIDHLAQRGIGVAPPIPSRRGRLVETVGDGHGEEFVVAAFRFADGHEPTLQEWAPPLWERYGRLIGEIHDATLQYRPKPGAERPHWDDDVMRLRSFLPDTELGAQRAFDEVLEHLGGLPRQPDSYGLIHADAHAANFHVTDDGAITLFDFDDCCHSWLVNDIALVVFYALSWVGDRDPVEYIARFWSHFWPAYRQVHHLDGEWLAEISWFLKARELDTYAVIHRSFDVDDIDDRWARWFMAGRKERIDSGVPVVDVDFAAL